MPCKQASNQLKYWLSTLAGNLVFNDFFYFLLVIKSTVVFQKDSAHRQESVH